MVYASLLLYGLMLGLALLAAGRGRPRGINALLTRLGFARKPLAGQLALAAVWLGLLLVAAAAIGAFANAAGMQEDAAKVRTALRGVPLVDLLAVLGIASIVEEIFFRGLLQRRVGLAAATFIFAYFHIIYGSVTEVLGAAVLGGLLGLEYIRAGSLLAPCLTHLAYNLLMIAIIFA